MEIVLCLCCETGVQDARTNNLSVFNVIDELHAVAFPITLPRFTAVIIVTKNVEEPDNIPATMKVTLIGLPLYLRLGSNFNSRASNALA
jgi:hypothetical protein